MVIRKILEQLKQNDPTLTELSLPNCHLAFKELIAFNYALKENKTLKILNLEQNKFSYLSIEAFICMLEKNTTLFVLNFDKNNLVKHQSERIEKFLKRNKEIEELYRRTLTIFDEYNELINTAKLGSLQLLSILAETIVGYMDQIKGLCSNGKSYCEPVQILEIKQKWNFFAGGFELMESQGDVLPVKPIESMGLSA